MLFENVFETLVWAFLSFGLAWQPLGGQPPGPGAESEAKEVGKSENPFHTPHTPGRPAGFWIRVPTLLATGLQPGARQKSHTSA